VLAEAPARLVLDSPEAINRAVEAGLGVAVQSAVIAERDVAAGRLRAVRLAGQPLRRQFSIVTLRGRIRSPATTTFITLLGASVGR
jgi:DNA-binding transcriptional LysR family regulator